ncbi:hypothetical protein NDI76_12290 [Halogeometricum sp. S1BR25-6]|uniref:VanZ-like domain-containing protein n=1 Tax=Halogeometricum salsisoli TaxID=2950536 RepID=A0ABU2GFF4_9EURY|nr:hypothetical protein [Halogeometricum sp. S1BR25-6]MDS0299522.1 hypothetical protein [Halogeometricum sp. S1BR25-6]
MSLSTLTERADPPNGPGWRFAVETAANRRTVAVSTAFVAALGLLPLYESVWWWDILTHALAGGAITGWLLLSGRRASAVVLLVALCSGAWELLEYATPTYVFIAGGAADTALDVVCNFAGSAVVAAAFVRVRSSLRRSPVDGGTGSRPVRSNAPADD